MTLLAKIVEAGNTLNFIADAAYGAGAVIQTSDGRAGVVVVDVASGAEGAVYVDGLFEMAKTTSMVLLKGNEAYWDYSADKAYYRPVNDHDFYIGRVKDDATSAATTCFVELNKAVKWDIDYKVDSGSTIPVGTLAAGAFGRGLSVFGPGTLNLNITATSEAQKIDWLSKDGFDMTANPIVMFQFSVPTGSAAGGTQDLNIGVATGTNATDADSITKHCFMHFDGNAVKLNFQSKDGTTTVAATDSLTTLTAGRTNAVGVRKEVWMDFRDLTSVKFYVDGVAVLTGTTFDVSAWSTTTAFLLAHLEKTTGTDTAEVDIDALKCRFARI